MKPYTIILAISVLLLSSGCGALRQTPEERQRTTELISQRLDGRDYRIDIDYMTPRRGGGKAVSGGYSVRVEGTIVDSHLPYAGVAYSVPYGGGKVLTFKDDIDKYEDSGWNKGRREVVLSTNNGEDTVVFTFTVYDDGHTDVHVHCRNREDISYRGTFSTREEDQD